MALTNKKHYFSTFFLAVGSTAVVYIFYNGNTHTHTPKVFPINEGKLLLFEQVLTTFFFSRIQIVEQKMTLSIIST